MTSMREQFRDNLLAIISLVVAFSALGYNTWRNEVTERNRNIRVAGIELLSEIGSLQQIVFYAHFAEDDQPDDQQRDPRGELKMGWVDMLTINDLAALMPAEVARDAANLKAVWTADSAGLIDDEGAFRRIDEAIDKLRQTTLAALRKLK